jgi:hypothetical protein
VYSFFIKLSFQIYSAEVEVGGGVDGNSLFLSSSFPLEYFSLARFALRAFCLAIFAAFCPFLLSAPFSNSSNFSRSNFLAIPLLSANDLDC